MKESINKAEEAYHKFKHTLEEESDSDSIDEVTIRGRCTRIKTCCETPENIFYTNNFIFSYDRDIKDSFMFDSDDDIFVFSDSNNIDLDKLPNICKINNSCNNLNFNRN